MRYARRLAITDFLTVAWAAIGAHTIQFRDLPSEAPGAAGSSALIALTATLAVLWLGALQLGSTREPSMIGNGAEEYKRVIQSTLGLFGLVAIASYIFNLHLPRSYVLVMMPAGLLVLLSSRFTWRRWLHGRRRMGEFSSKLLVVGNVRTVRELLADLRRAPLAGYSVIGVCAAVKPVSSTNANDNSPELLHNGGHTLGDVDGVPILGNLDEVASVAERYGADTVAVTATSAFGPTRVRQLGWELESTDVELVLAPALTNIAGPRIHTKPVAGLPLIHVDRPTYRGANRALKKSFDLVGGVLLILVFAPLLAALAISVKLSDGGPIFFKQERVGLNGKTFNVMKFRSMVPDAEALLATLLPARRDAGNDVLFKMKNDPRITKLGRLLRRLSLDELPQLFNVIAGDMSLVGPRPPLVSETESYGVDARRRLLVRPGMTGLWQVSGRSDLSWDDTVRLDVYYVENWSITSDLVILWKTLQVVSAKGAY